MKHDEKSDLLHVAIVAINPRHRHTSSRGAHLRHTLLPQASLPPSLPPTGPPWSLQERSDTTTRASLAARMDDDDDDRCRPFLDSLAGPPPERTAEDHDLSHPSARSHDGGTRRGLQRCRTAPAMSVVSDLTRPGGPATPRDPNPRPGSASGSVVRQALFFLCVYLLLGVGIYAFNRDRFSGVETHPVVDALYFCIVTMCTIGYGDIAPLTPGTKAFACVFVLVGFGFIGILLSGVVNFVLDLQENMILTTARLSGEGGGSGAVNYFVDVEKGRMRIRLKVGLALGVVVLCIGMGALVLCFVEGLDWLDSVYLAVMSVTTVGYGDRAFKTLPGRLFAAVWLLVSTLVVARAFLYLAEARIDKRHRRIAKLVLHRDVTVEDFLAANLNNNGFISKSEYVLYKLKEMERISETDILQICDQFSKLDRNNSGKITLLNLLDNHL